MGVGHLKHQNEQARCDLDQPYSFAFNYVYDLPFFKAQQGVLGRVLGRWEWSGITTYAAGYPFTVTETGNRSGTGNAGRPNVVGPLYVEPGNVARYFNTAAFAPQPLGQFGNAGRDILRGPGLGVWNMSLYKNTPFQLGGREITLKFGSDVFNVFNQVSFNGVGATMGTPAFGRLTSALDPRQADFKIELTY